MEKKHYYIDKTAKLKKALESFPSIYVEGAAASGKSTAVQMFLEHVSREYEICGYIKDEFETIVDEIQINKENTSEENTVEWNTTDRNTDERNKDEWNTDERNIDKENTAEWDTTERNTEEETIEEENPDAKKTLRLQCFDMHLEQKDTKSFVKKLYYIQERAIQKCAMQKCTIQKCVESDSLIIFENLHEIKEKQMYHEIAEFLYCMGKHCRSICVSREEPPVEFLSLIWNRKMEQISMVDLLLTKNEVAQMLEHTGAKLNLDELYAVTGGWTGCVDLMLRSSVKAGLSIWESSDVSVTAADLRKSYEVDTYIKEAILNTLSVEEDMLMQRGQVCPWLNQDLCREVWGMQKAEPLLARLTRKGFFLYDARKKHWKVAPLFRKQGRAEKRFWKQLGSWYEKQNYIKEALECFGKSDLMEEYKACMLRHYTELPYGGIPYDVVMIWKESGAKTIYLRAMYCYETGELKGFEKELQRFQEKVSRITDAPENMEKYFHYMEIFLNLQYLNVNVSLDAWLELVKNQFEKTGRKISMYQLMGYSSSALCGLRDLTELFACTKKEENRKMRIWKECLDDASWVIYRMAKMEYYLETDRGNTITQEDREFLMKQVRIDALNLMIKQHIYLQKEDTDPRIEEMAELLSRDDHAVIAKMARSLQNLYLSWRRQSERLVHWVRHTEERKLEINEETYFLMIYLVKGYLQFQQYEKAKRILSLLIPYLKLYRRGYLLAEHLYQMAMIRWEENHHGQALQYMIESFLISRQARYVGFYASYGKNGMEVLEAYEKWQQTNTPEGWHRKKKYQYGNVLRMPEADYMGVIMRCIKRQSKASSVYQEESREEHLTMMEMIILQDINRGLTNGEICRELNLKLPTVKTHIYSLYKKLGVNTRVQAIIKGKERGLLG